MKDGETAEVDPEDPPPLVVKVTHVNQHSHLDNVVSLCLVLRIFSIERECSILFEQKRQQGGIGSSAYDPKQKDIRAFFGGATVSADSTADSSDNSKTEQLDEHLTEGRAASNVFDETEPSSESRL